MPQEPPPAGATPALVLLRMLRGYWVSQAIAAAAQLGIADDLADGPRSCADLAELTGVPARSLHRLLRALASVDVFAEVEDGRFGLTPLADCLRKDVPGSLRASGILTAELLHPAWSELLRSLRTGGPSFEHVFGASFFAHLAAHPESGERFQEMMAHLNLVTNAAVPAAYDFSRCSTIVDVRGTGGDTYLLRWILHDFDDERAARILRACRAAMPPDGRLLVIERVVAGRGQPGEWMTKFLDLQMLILLGGQERTEAEFRELFAATGFRLQRVIPTASPSSVLEAVLG